MLRLDALICPTTHEASSSSPASPITSLPSRSKLIVEANWSRPFHGHSTARPVFVS